jgi:glycyl-tRNA synthetase (class II)
VVDFETFGQEAPELADTVTVRNRDTGVQERVAIKDLINKLK